MFLAGGGSDADSSKIPSHLASLEKDVSELRFLRRTLEQRIEAFDNKRANVKRPLMESIRHS